jgi:hypothetical protein
MFFFLFFWLLLLKGLLIVGRWMMAYFVCEGKDMMEMALHLIAHQHMQTFFWLILVLRATSAGGTQSKGLGSYRLVQYIKATLHIFNPGPWCCPDCKCRYP